MTEAKFYVLGKDSKVKTIFTENGDDPLKNHGGWEVVRGPFETWERAQDSILFDIVAELKEG